ncbi:MAG: MATE family efflux transporter [Limnochordales bacterium]
MASQEPSRRLWLSREVHRELLRLSLPTIVSTLAVPLLGLVDTIVLGRLPQVEPLGAAAAANTIFTSLFWVFGFLRMGTTALVAQASGRRDEDEAARTLFQALAIGAVVAVLLVVLQGPIGWVGFALIGAEPEVDRLARQYFAIRIFEAPAFMLSLGITGYLRGRGDAITPMLLVVLINTLNIVGDLLLVPGTWGLPSYGVRGAAWASLVAHTVGCGAGAVVVWRRVRTRWRWQWLAQWRQLPWRRFLHVQRDLFLRTLALVASLGAVTAFAARLHNAHELAAHAILLQLYTLGSYGVDGFAYATETTVGTWLGHGNRARAQASAVAALVWGAGLALAASAFYGVSVDWVAAVFTHDPTVQAVVRRLTGVVAVILPVAALAFVFDGIMIGATDTRYLRNAMFISAAVFAAVLLASWRWVGRDLAVIWWSKAVFLGMRALTLGIRFASGRWCEGALAPVPARAVPAEE